MVTVAITRLPAGTSTAPVLTDVHEDTAFGVCPAAPEKEPFAMVAAAGYKRTFNLEAVVFGVGNLDSAMNDGAGAR